MTPIINPIWFYLIDVLSSAKGYFKMFNSLIFAGLIVVAIGAFAGMLVMEIDGEGLKEICKKLKNVKKYVVYLMIVMFVGLAIPSEETMYKMIVASNVTYENVETAGNVIKDSVDHIFEKFNGEEQK